MTGVQTCALPICVPNYCRIIISCLQFDAPSPGTDKDLAWAAADSAKIEAERQRKLEEQEKADFEFALALSRAET